MIELDKNFYKSLASELRSKLEKLKASKAKAYDNPNDALEAIIKEGYVDKIKFMGFTYELQDERINFRSLKDKAEGKTSHWSSNKSYVEYRIDRNSAEYDKLRRDIESIREKMKADTEKANSKEEIDTVSELYYQEKDKITPPNDFKIVLKFDGGKIVPDYIEIGKEKAYAF